MMSLKFALQKQAYILTSGYVKQIEIQSKCCQSTSVGISNLLFVEW